MVVSCNFPGTSLTVTLSLAELVGLTSAAPQPDPVVEALRQALVAAIAATTVS